MVLNMRMPPRPKPKRPIATAVFLHVLLLILPIAVWAQPGRPGEPGAGRGPADRGRHILDLPDFQEKVSPFAAPESSPLLDMPLPPPPPPEKKDSLPTASTVRIREIKIVGSTLFSDEQLSELSSPYRGRQASFEDLERLRHRLTMLYVDAGYINSGAVLPDQTVTNGVVTYRIIEGTISGMNITGLQKLRKRYIQSRLERAAAPPVNIFRLQKTVQLMDRDPLIEKITVRLVPGLAPGESLLNVEVEEARPYVLGVRLGNDQPPSVGAEHLMGYAAHRNLTGWGDRLRLEYGLTEGLDDFSALYEVPITRYDTRLKVYYEKNDAVVVEAPLDEIDIEGASDTFGLELRHPLYKTAEREFAVSVVAERRHSETFLSGRPFSFSAGADRGESDVSVLRLVQEWIDGGSDQIVAARSMFSIGIDAFGATRNDQRPDGRFVSWLGQFQWAKRIEKLRRSHLIFKTDVQLSKDPLLSLEKFSVGGATSVRGYRENQFVRDNGVVLSLEWRIPVFQLSVPNISQSPSDGTVYVAPFTDWGWSWESDRDTQGPRSLSSAGIGIRWDPGPNLQANLYWGYAFRNIDTPDNDLQDDGFHFLVDWRFF